MTALPNIVSEQQVTENGLTTVKLVLFVPANLSHFSGHFPNQPILPGVVQLDWAIYYATQYLSLASGDFKAVEVLKYQVVIQPESEVELLLTQKADDKFTFSYHSSDGQHSSGRVKMAS